MKNPKLLVGLAIAVLLAIVFLQNRQQVETKILFFTVSSSRAAMLGLSFLAGAASGALVVAVLRARRGDR